MYLCRSLPLAVFFVCLQAIVVFAMPQIHSEAVYVMNANSNQVLYEKNGDKLMYPASTVKIMTALVALKYGNPNSIVTISPTAAGLEGSSLNLKPGDRLTLGDLLRGMMATSGNDAAQAVAEQVGNGSSQKFIDLMNKEAKALGASHTHFSNPHGLPSTGYATAHDLAVITAAAYQQPGFADCVNAKSQTIHFLNRGDQAVENINKLLGSYPDCNGVKTGTTQQAGECLVASAQRDGTQVIAVVLRSEDRWQDAAALLDYGFEKAAVPPAAPTVSDVPPASTVTKQTQGTRFKKTKASPDTASAQKAQVKKYSANLLVENSDRQASDIAHLLEVSRYGNKSYDAAYLFQTDLSDATGFIGPVLRHETEPDKNSIGIRFACITSSDDLLEGSIYGKHCLDAAYLFMADIFNTPAYIGPTMKYNHDNHNKVTFGLQLAFAL